ncbi:MAG: hypothetical protein ABIY70_08890 [Capsulimonas sp.]|uniref:hypothetical protein n=1 Tax=Capsulimonas sp. TaxID=2494211 RepID=UPI00326671ED
MTGAGSNSYSTNYKLTGASRSNKTGYNDEAKKLPVATDTKATSLKKVDKPQSEASERKATTGDAQSVKIRGRLSRIVSTSVAYAMITGAILSGVAGTVSAQQGDHRTSNGSVSNCPLASFEENYSSTPNDKSTLSRYTVMDSNEVTSEFLTPEGNSVATTSYPDEMRIEYDVLTDKLLGGTISRREERRLAEVEHAMDAHDASSPAVTASRASVDQLYQDIHSYRIQLERSVAERKRANR